MEAADRLIEIMRRLRAPEEGCPWDLEQDFATIAPHTIEEAYEVADAIERDDMEGLRDELGDLLFQVVFHAQMAEEAGLFNITDVVEGLNDKMVRRHPHVFAGASIADADAQTAAWEAQKAAERRGGVLDDVPRALPALRRAAKLGKRAASVGFDWPQIDGVRATVVEELEELDAEITSGDRDAMERELGDVLFALVNLGRHLGVDAETALQGTNNRFRSRFGHLEQAVSADGRRPEQCDLDELEALWQAAKDAT
ncbi:MAG: nucleoside triphosphate pyrophosphohydrolase [Gammaproteobacteria bacterium]|nr:nucleoside triphosphate pyrophosphohydrolase [Gammaproteobacteria bacterium]NNF61280.1 nucleoside triphosphate pyrophosphohydrolase [Gammaproteobacteria bacterium]